MPAAFYKNVNNNSISYIQYIHFFLSLLIFIQKYYYFAEENSVLQQMMANIIEEAGIRVKEEMENVKQQYNGKLKILLVDMRKLEDVSILTPSFTMLTHVHHI